MSAKIEAGTIVEGRFALEAKIGQGGMGSVWRARDTNLDTVCALKFIDPELLGHPAAKDEALARFEREAKAAAKIGGDHVVKILAHGTWGNIPFIAMDFLVGEDLGRRLQKRGRIPAAELYPIIEQVVRALNKAHSVGIVHRDLKPDNIYLVVDDDRETAKIVDFGIAKHAVDALQGSKTRTGSMLGTPYYMSPEQAQGLKVIDGRSDLWSLAVIVYQCLTGKLPFESDALGDLIVRIVVGKVPVPSEEAPGATPPAFDAWWARATQRDPNARFANGKEFVASLGMALGITGGASFNARSSSLVDPSDLAPSNGRPFGATPSGSGATGAMPPPNARTVPFVEGGPAAAAVASYLHMASSPGNPATPAPWGASSDGKTYGGVASPLPATNNRLPLILGVAMLMTVVVGGGIVGAILSLRGKASTATAVATASPPTSSVSVAATTPPDPTPTASATEAAADTSTPTASAPTATTPTAPPATATAVATGKTPPKPPPPPKPKTPKTNDLGF